MNCIKSLLAFTLPAVDRNTHSRSCALSDRLQAGSADRRSTFCSTGATTFNILMSSAKPGSVPVHAFKGDLSIEEVA